MAYTDNSNHLDITNKHFKPHICELNSLKKQPKTQKYEKEKVKSKELGNIIQADQPTYICIYQTLE